MNARLAKESIEHICNVLAFFGVRTLNPETFRLAKLGDDKVTDKLWIGLYQLIVLHSNNFRLRLAHNPVKTAELEQLVTYALYRYKLPFHLQNKSNYLLLAFGFLINHVDLFGKYDSYFAGPATGMTTIEELNSEAASFIQNSLQTQEPSWRSILALYKKVEVEIRETYAQAYYTAQIIGKVHDSDPSLNPEDIWLAGTEERIEKFVKIMAEAERAEERKEEEFKLRANFWKWIEGVVDSVEDVQEVNASETCNLDFKNMVTGIENNFRFIQSVWNEIKAVVLGIDEKVKVVLANYPEAQDEFERVFKEMAVKLPTFEEYLEKVRKSGEIPNIVPIVSNLVKERSDGDVALAKKVDALVQDLSKAQAAMKISVFKVMKNVPGVKTYNL